MTLFRFSPHNGPQVSAYNQPDLVIVINHQSSIMKEVGYETLRIRIPIEDTTTRTALRRIGDNKTQRGRISLLLTNGMLTFHRSNPQYGHVDGDCVRTGNSVDTQIGSGC